MQEKDSKWAWLLLLPLFFIGGWVLNDAYKPPQPHTGPQAGIGGAPFEEDPPIDTSITSPTPTVSSGAIPPTPDITYFPTP